MSFDPFKDAGATELAEEFDPFKDGGATELKEQGYLADKARRLGRSIPENIGQTVAGMGSAVHSAAELAAEALRWRAVRSGDLTEAEAAKAKQEFLERASRTAPMQAAQAVRDVGQELTDVGPRHFAPPDPARDGEIGAAVASGAGSLVPLLAAGAVAPALAIPGAAAMMGEQQREDAAKHGATPTQEAASYMLGAPTGAVSEAFLGVPAMLRSVRGAKAVPEMLGKAATGIDGLITGALGKLAPAIVPAAQQAVKSAVREGIQEGLEQIAQNTIAKDAVGYDPTRDRTEGAGMAALAGGIVGGGVGAAHQVGHDLDTRQNLAESKKTLLAQQQQLMRGQRPAQMFPVDAEGKVTNELPLPPEMQRLATERGVFHYNPALIDEATLRTLSGAGQENGPLGLGSQSKADVAKKVAQGDPAIAVTERQPDGTEVKTAISTQGTAQKTTAELERSKTPGNTVQTEPIAKTVQERSGNFVQDLLAKDAAAAAAAREARAQEEAARTARQQELDQKKARFDERLALARQTLADPAAPFAKVKGALESITSYAEDNALGLTQTQRELALQTQAALTQRQAQLAPAAEAAADTLAAQRRTEAQLAADATKEKIRRERAALQHLETTGRDLATGEITDLRYVPDADLARLDAEAEGLTPQQIEAEQQRRGEAAERAAATQNEAGYTLRDLIFGKKSALAAAGQTGPLRLKSPTALAQEGGTMAGEHRALGERQGGFKIFAETGLAEDTLQDRLQSLGFNAPDVTTAYALYERALGGEEIRPERSGEGQIDFAARRGDTPPADPYAYPDQKTSAAGAAEDAAPGDLPRAAGRDARPAATPEPAGQVSPGRPGRGLAPQTGFPGITPTAEQLRARSLPEIEALLSRNAAGRDTAARAVNQFIDEQAGKTPHWRRLDPDTGQLRPFSEADARALDDAIKAFDAGQEFVWPSEALRDRIAAYFAESPASPKSSASSASSESSPSRPILTDSQVAEQLAALRREFPTLTRDLDLRSGLVADELKRAGYHGPVPAGVQAAILRLKAEKRLLVIAAQAAQRSNTAGLFLHEMAHPFFDAIPAETKTILRELHAHEMASKTGPLFDEHGALKTDLFVRAEDFAPARLRADPDLPVKEWFAERVRALNTEWLAGRMPRDHSTLVRVWHELLAKLRQVFAQVRGLDADSDLFTANFRTWLDSGAKASVEHAGLAYATRQKAEFASNRKPATAHLTDPAPRTAFRDAEEQGAYLNNPDNFADRPYPGVVKGTPLWIRHEALAKKSLELDTERRRQKLSFDEIETIARRATGKRWPDFQDVADYDRTLAELRDPGSQVGNFPGGQTEIKFASFQDTLDLGSTPLGVTLPTEIRNLAPRWQDKTLTFESSLDKALFYAGGTNSETRARIIASLAEQTTLTPGQIATLARELRERIAPLARQTASDGTVRVPAQMRQATAKLTGAEFAEAKPATLPKPWDENLRDAQIMTSVAALRAHEMYREAKAGSANHAWFVVTALINPAKLKALHDQHPAAILAPVHARERQGKNALPQALAEAMAAAHPSWTVDENIVQRAGMGHTDATALARLANPAQFEGAVQAGKNYILLDDVLTSGSTINALRAHIEAGGGKVVAVNALAASGNPQTGAGQNLAPRPDVLQKLDAKFGQAQIAAFLQEHNIAESSHALTNSQARYLLAFATLDRAGSSITAARRAADRPTAPGNRGDDTNPTGGIEKADTGQTGRVDFATGPQTATPEFKAWFGDSKVVDAQGKPQRVYHGSVRADRIGNRFQKKRATSGPMAFFTDSPDLASSYSTKKADTSLETPSDYSEWFRYKGKGMRSSVPIDRAWWSLTPEQRSTVLARIPTIGYTDPSEASGPIVGNTESIMGNDSIAYELRQARGNGLRALTEIWLNSSTLFNDEAQFIDVLKAAGLDMTQIEFADPNMTRSGVYPVYLKIRNPLLTTAIPPNVIAALDQAGKRKRAKIAAGGNPDLWDKNTISGPDWLAELHQNLNDSSAHVWTRIPDWVTETLQGLGYDGVQDKSGKGGGEIHNVWIPFNETQVKSATGNRGTFDPLDARIDFATGPERDLRAQMKQIDSHLAALENSQEDPADVARTGQRLTAERERLRRQLETETREASAAKSLIDVRHPAAVALPSEPGDAWAMAPKMTDAEITAERASITQHIHDHAAGLAPAMQAHLAARLNALAAEQIARGTPLGTVAPIPKIDRQAALKGELTRGRALRDEGDRTGNATAQAEGVRIVKAATARLDEEFPGWDKKPAPAKNDGAQRPPPPERPTAEAAPASEGDGEQSPFSGGEEETMPVRPGKFNEVYGHDTYQPSFLLRSWRKIRDAITGIKGPIPELPTFPAARWNKTDTFIAEHGPQFYARVSEGERALKSANDYIQRTAEEQVGRIITPLLKAGEKFNADDYAQLRRRQEQARRLKAEGKPVPPGVAAEIAALNSKMESSPYVLFNRLVLALDLHWRQQNLKDSAGNPIKLPAGVNARETAAEVQRLGERIAASPHAALIQTAVEQHMALIKQTAEELKTRELLAPDHLANPYYFPHITLETTRGGKTEQRELRPSRVRPGTEADFRGYLVDPVGSTKAISTDYVRSMYYHLVQMGAHNFKADAVRDYFRPYDIKTTVEARAKELTKQRGRPVSWEQAFHEEFAPRGYVLYGTDSRDAFPTLTVNRDALARRLGVMLTGEDIHKQLAELGQKNVKLLPEDLRETLAMGARETWILPARVAEALRGIADRAGAQHNAIEAAAKFTIGIWKGWKLFMPWNHVRYEYGNVVADLEKLLSSSPGTFKQLPNAAKELRAFWTGGEPSADLRAALKEGVINAITAQELDGLVRQKAFEALQTRAEKAVDFIKRRGSSIVYQPATNLLGLGDFSSPELSALREAITRYAKFKNDLTAIRAGARPDYAGAYWKNIEAMTDSRPGAGDADVRKAAAISKATFGDYGDLSILGQATRDRLVPFYSWMEINFRYHANMLRNLRDMVRADEMGATQATGQAARTAAVAAAGFTARTAGGIALRLALPYMAVALWNSSGDRDELEKLLSEEDRRRFHIILGRDAQGKVQVVYGQTALNDVLKWFSGQKFAQAMGQWFNGKTDFPTAIGSWKDALAPDLANNVVGSVGPAFKIPYAIMAKKSTFPDVTDQKTIPAYDMRRNIIGQMTDDFTADAIERTVSKDYYGSKDVGDWAKQLILQVRQRDPESWAFYAIKDKANDYLEKRTGMKRDSSVDAPDQQVLRNFRRAIYRGDVDKAVQFYQRLLDYGYTSERFASSIQSQDPLSALPKENGLRQQFVAGLTPDDRALLARAYTFYERMASSRGREAQLFPHKASGMNGQLRYQAQPRTDALRAQMERVDGMSDEERDQRGQRDLRRSLQRTH